MSKIPGDESTQSLSTASAQPWSYQGKKRTTETRSQAVGSLDRRKSSGNVEKEAANRQSVAPVLEMEGPPVATQEDVQELKDEIKKQTVMAKDSAVSAAREYADQKIRMLEFSLKDMVLSSADPIKDSLANHDSRIEDIKSEIERMNANFTAQLEALEQGIRSIMTEMLPSTHEQIEGVRKHLHHETSSLHDKHDRTSKSVLERIESNKTAVDSVNDSLSTYKKEQKVAANAVSAEIEELRQKGDDLRHSLSCNVDELHNSLDGLHQELDASISDLGARADSRLVTLETRTAQLATQSSQILSMPVRRVEWVIRDASQFVEDAFRAAIKSWAVWHSDSLDSSEPQHVPPWRCWFSPEFEASGANGLQLELQVLFSLRESSQKQDEEKVDDDTSSNKESNECILRLWAPKGVYMHFKLHVGSDVMELQHEFDGESPCAMKRCLLSDALDVLANTLHFGVDVLEAFQGMHLPTVTLSSARGQGAIEVAPTNSGNIRSENPQGSLTLYNHMCPGSSVHLGKIEDQLNLVKSRLIGRVDWVLQDASTMPELFAQGEHVCSPVFTASGAEGLQLVFFPSGETGATPCWCSFYLYYPGKTQLLCWLWVGKQRRELTHAARDRPGFFGRTNFAIYQMVIDHASDSLTLAVEICDLQTVGNEVVAYDPAPRAVPWPQKLSPCDAPPVGFPKLLENFDSRDDALTDEQPLHMSQPQVFEHTSRLYGRAGRLAFHDVKTLPSIFSVMKPEAQRRLGPAGVWSFQPKQIIQGMPDRYFKCSDFRALRQEANSGENLQPTRPTSSHGYELAPLRRTPQSPRPSSDPLSNRDASPYTKPTPTVPVMGAPSNLANRAKHRTRPAVQSRGVNPKAAVVPEGAKLPEGPLSPLTPRYPTACDASQDSDALLAHCG